MRVYLINKNPVVAKLVALSVAKANLELVESQEMDVTLEAEIIFIDDECYDKELIDTYKQNFGNAKISLLYAKSRERIAGFDEYIQKPFLPTDLFDVLVKLSGITPNDVKLSFDERRNKSMDLDSDDIHELESLQILDKDDIDEVKGLFDEKEEQDDIADLESEDTLETPEIEDLESSIKEPKEPSEEKLDLTQEDDPTSDLEDEIKLDSLTPEDNVEDLQSKNALESKKDKTSSNVDALEDEFSALNLEGVSEALGEPIAKEPNIAPIVSQPKEEETLPNIQANSLEGLITALQTLQTQTLKDLLSGAVININIQFPKKDDN